MSISIVFRIVNIVIFFALIIYVIRKKFSASIASKVQRKDLELEVLIQKKKEMDQRTENIKITIGQEHAFMNKLKRNIEAWQKMCRDTQKEKQESRIKMVRMLEEKMQAQLRKKNSNLMQKNIVSNALAQTKLALEDSFQDSQKQRSYLNALVERMDHHEHRAD